MGEFDKKSDHILYCALVSSGTQATDQRDRNKQAERERERDKVKKKKKKRDAVCVMHDFRFFSATTKMSTPFPSQEHRPLKKPRLGPPDVYPQDPKQKEVNGSPNIRIQLHETFSLSLFSALTFFPTGLITASADPFTLVYATANGRSCNMCGAFHFHLTLNQLLFEGRLSLNIA